MSWTASRRGDRLNVCEKILRRGWVKSDKKPAKNPELWGRLLDLLDRHEVRFHWVKGHADNPYNNRCDELAVAEYQKYK